MDRQTEPNKDRQEQTETDRMQTDLQAGRNAGRLIETWRDKQRHT